MTSAATFSPNTLAAASFIKIGLPMESKIKIAFGNGLKRRLEFCSFAIGAFGFKLDGIFGFLQRTHGSNLFSDVQRMTVNAIRLVLRI